jgi:predicted CXXCH cytochrome family protein
MDHASDKSVLGNFADASFDYYGTRSRFFRQDGKFLVETDGPNGKLGIFEIKYTFGVDPLQQYLVAFPDGRLQALPLAWDSRPKETGGQHWFHLYPNEAIRHDDVLHWTRLNQNWNFMCAECHSTGVRKNYDAAADRFATSFAEISVGCEACHGQGSRHVGWARDRQSWWRFGKSDDPTLGLLVRFGERDGVTWESDPATFLPHRSSAPVTLRKEVETCGLCHARRGQFSEDWVPGRWLSETHTVSPLARGLYQADGQTLDEVYNYGSFKQSRMFAAGVTCSDCHEPHGATLRVSGDGLCLQCHAADKYSASAHSGHDGVTPAPSCVSCHMPVRTYMVVDQRHDHGFRIPRPDQSAKLGTSNACNDCHADKSAEWAAAAVERWHGPNRSGFQNYTAAFHAAWTGAADAATLLGAVAADANAPAFARASALSELAARVSPSNINLAQAGIRDRDPMVRIGALDMLENVPAAQIWPLASPLLADPVRGVRIRAAALLAGAPMESQPQAERERFERAAAEFVAAQRFNADRPEARSALGNFYAGRGRLAAAEAEYMAALRLSPQYVPAAINLVDLYRRLGREAEGEGVLRAAITASPDDAGVHHALGLALVRLKRPDEALGELRRSAELEPDRARYAYVYAVALYSAGRGAEAVTILKESLKQHSDDRDILSALIAFSREAGDMGSALDYAERLARIEPSNRNLSGLIQDLRRQTQKAGDQ